MWKGSGSPVEKTLPLQCSGSTKRYLVLFFGLVQALSVMRYFLDLGSFLDTSRSRSIKGSHGGNVNKKHLPGNLVAIVLYKLIR